MHGIVISAGYSIFRRSDSAQHNRHFDFAGKAFEKAVKPACIVFPDMEDRHRRFRPKHEIRQLRRRRLFSLTRKPLRLRKIRSGLLRSQMRRRRTQCSQNVNIFLHQSAIPFGIRIKVRLNGHERTFFLRVIIVINAQGHEENNRGENRHQRQIELRTNRTQKCQRRRHARHLADFDELAADVARQAEVEENEHRADAGRPRESAKRKHGGEIPLRRPERHPRKTGAKPAQHPFEYEPKPRQSEKIREAEKQRTLARTQRKHRTRRHKPHPHEAGVNDGQKQKRHPAERRVQVTQPNQIDQPGRIAKNPRRPKPGLPRGPLHSPNEKRHRKEPGTSRTIRSRHRQHIKRRRNQN